MKKFFNYKNNRGVTLVELLVAIAIMGVISVLIFANYHYGDKQMELDMQTQRFVQDVRRVQEWALSARDFGAGAKKGYGIYVNIGQPNTYILYTDNNDNKSYDAGEAQETITLNNNIEISNADNSPLSINFSPPNPTTLMNNDANIGAAAITFRIKGTARTCVISINRTGLVYVQ